MSARYHVRISDELICRLDPAMLPACLAWPRASEDKLEASARLALRISDPLPVVIELATALVEFADADADPSLAGRIVELTFGATLNDDGETYTATLIGRHALH